MKKLLISFILLLSMLFSVGFAGCEKSENPDETTQKEYSVVFADFEDWKPDFSTMRISEYFGKVTRNEESAYVKSGKYSAKIQATGAYTNKNTIFLYFPTISTTFDFDYSNFFKMKRIGAWLYNAEETEQEIGFAFVTGIESSKSITTFEYSRIQLPAKQWTYFKADIDVDALNLLIDLNSIQGIAFTFNNANTRDIEDAPVIYLDDIVFDCYEVALAERDLITLDIDEVCNFEKLYQKYVVMTSSENGKFIPTVEIVKPTLDNDELVASSGDYVLKLTTKPSDRENTNSGRTYQRFTLPAKLMQQIGITTIEQDQWENVYFCMDVYNPTDSEQLFYLEWLSTVKYNGTIYNFTVKPGEWTTFKWSLSQIASATESKAASTYRITQPGTLSVAWGEYPMSHGEKTFYFDNFRIERVNA